MHKMENSEEKFTKVVFNAEAKEVLLKGVTIAANAVCATLGPRGKTVLIQNGDAAPVVTKDGVTVSKSIHLKDNLCRMGAQLVREAASQTNDVAGDGTTTATALTYALIKSGMMLTTAGHSQKGVIEGVNKAFEAVREVLEASAKKVETYDEIKQIGTISANGDEVIGGLIADAMEKVGKDGIITVEDAKGMSTSLTVVEGMQFDRGYVSPYFVTNAEKMHASYNDLNLLLVDGKLNDLKALVPALELALQRRTPLLIIADDIEGDALHGIVLNRVNGNLPVVAVKAPGYGQHKSDLMGDIAALTGATIVSSATGVTLKNVTDSTFGKLTKAVVDGKSTIIVANKKNNSQLADRIKSIQAQLEDVTLSQDEKQKLKVRLAKLSSGVAIIKVGGSTEVEMVERKYRIEDALNATKAAVEAGVIPGGGKSLFDASRSIKSQFDSMDQGDVKVGAMALLEACKYPLRRIVENAGSSPDVVCSKLEELATTQPNFGYNAANGKYVDLITEGIIDPVKVTITALKNAVSVATTFLSLDAVIVEELHVTQIGINLRGAKLCTLW